MNKKMLATAALFEDELAHCKLSGSYSTLTVSE